MKKRMKSLLCMVCALCLILAACGQPAGTDSSADSPGAPPDSSSLSDVSEINLEGYPVVNEKITFSLMGSKAPIQGPWDTLLFFKEMEEMTNIAFTFDTPVSDAFEEKKNLAINTGEYPDIFLGANLTSQQEIRYGSNDGILIPLEDLIEQYCPNIMALFEEHPDVRKSVTAPDGHIYALPQVSKGVKWSPTFWVNVEWMEALGLTEEDLPTTAEGLYDLLIRFRDEDPNGNGEKDELPISMEKPTETASHFRDMFLGAFGILKTTNHISVQDDVVRFSYTEPNYKEYLKYCNKLWEEGLIDRDSYVQDSSARDAKCKTNLVGIAQQAIPQNLYDVTDPEEAAKYPVLPALSSSFSDKQLTTTGTGMSRGVFALTNKCENPAAMMRWVDYLYSEEGSFFVHYGPEDDLWEATEEGLHRYIDPQDGRTIEEYRGGVLTPDCGTALPKWVRDDTERSWDDAFQQYRIDYCIDTKLAPYSVIAFPDVYATPEEQAELDEVIVDINKYTASMEAKFITGEASVEKEYDAFLDTLKGMGVERVVEIYQAAYDRWNNS